MAKSKQLTEAEIQTKKASILDYARIGVPFDRACILANITSELKDELYNDEAFQFYFQQGKALLEYELLEQIVSVAKNSAVSGITSDARWLLERLNPEAFGKVSADVKISGFDIPDEYKGI